MKRQLIPALSICLLVCFILCGCSSAGSAAQTSSAADPEANEKSYIFVDSMSTYMTLTAYGSNRAEALEAAKEEILRLNDIFSVGTETSDIAVLNSTGTVTAAPETLYLVKRAEEINSSTGGCFDITVYPLMELWGFTSQNYKIPSDEEIDALLEHVGSDKIQIDDDTSTITLDTGAGIDLGGIAKGYTSSRVMEIFEEHGVTSGIVSLGGNVQCLNLKPDGSKWKVGIRAPWGSEADLVAVIEVEDSAVITSGAYERYFEQDGRIYCHILDPQTGRPVESDLDSVTIVTPDGTLADGLSTSLFIMGFEEASDYWREHSDEFQVIFITTDGTIYASEGLENSITPGSEKITVEIIR